MNPDMDKKSEKNTIYIVIDKSNGNGQSSIIAVFSNYDNAKLFLADYVLEKIVYTDDLDIIKKEIDESL